MCSHSRECALLAVIVAALSLIASPARADCPCDPASAAAGPALDPAPSTQPAHTLTVLRICADANNLPFSNEKRDGFENKIAQLIADDLQVPLRYTWRAQRRGFIRQTLKAGTVDLVMGIPTGSEQALTTHPYYRSSYVFVSRRDRHLQIDSFDDPLLRKLKIGVQLTGDENTPPAQALGLRGLSENIVGYPLFGDYRQPNPPAAIVQSVADKKVDLAVIWGPLAGYFARQQSVPLRLTPIMPGSTDQYLRFSFDISMGVRKGNTPLRDRLNEILSRRQAQIDQILDRYGIPRAMPARPEVGSIAR